MCACVHHVYVCGRLSTCTYMCIHLEAHSWVSSLITLHFIYQVGDLLIQHFLTWTNLASQLVSGAGGPLLCPWCSGITSSCHVYLAFAWVLGIQTLVLTYKASALSTEPAPQHTSSFVVTFFTSLVCAFFLICFPMPAGPWPGLRLLPFVSHRYPLPSP